MEREKRGGPVLWVLAAVLIVLVFVSFLLGRYPVPPAAVGGILLHKLLTGLGKLLSPLIPEPGAGG